MSSINPGSARSDSDLLLACLRSMEAGDQQFVEIRSAYPWICFDRWEDSEGAVAVIMRRLPQITQATAESFYRNNVARTPLDLQSATAIGMRAVSEQELGEVVNRITSMDWGNVYPEGTNGLMSLSHPGLDSDGNQGLVYGMTYDGPEGGSGSLYIFNRSEGIWRVAERVRSWLS